MNTDQPVLVDKYIMGKELEVDAICDGKYVFIPGIMEHVERTGVHSGDSISVYPTFSVSQKVKDQILDYTQRLGIAIGIVGLFNIQFIADSDEKVYIIEVNPRSSRTVPFLSKATSVPMAHIATQVILGHSLEEQGYTRLVAPEKKRWNIVLWAVVLVVALYFGQWPFAIACLFLLLFDLFIGKKANHHCNNCGEDFMHER